MLTHPTLAQLYALGLRGMAKAFADIEAGGEAASLGHAEWLALLLEREASLRRCDATSDCRSGFNMPSCASRPASKTSTIAPRAASTAAC